MRICFVRSRGFRYYERSTCSSLVARKIRGRKHDFRLCKTSSLAGSRTTRAEMCTLSFRGALSSLHTVRVAEQTALRGRFCIFAERTTWAKRVARTLKIIATGYFRRRSKSYRPSSVTVADEIPVARQKFCGRLQSRENRARSDRSYVIGDMNSVAADRNV